MFFWKSLNRVRDHSQEVVKFCARRGEEKWRKERRHEERRGEERRNGERSVEKRGELRRGDNILVTSYKLHPVISHMKLHPLNSIHDTWIWNQLDMRGFCRFVLQTNSCRNTIIVLTTVVLRGSVWPLGLFGNTNSLSEWRLDVFVGWDLPGLPQPKVTLQQVRKLYIWNVWILSSPPSCEAV